MAHPPTLLCPLANPLAVPPHPRLPSWFGLETADFALHGLWCVNMISTLDFVAANRFNCLRVPFSAELALDMDGKRPGNIDTSANPQLAGLTTGQVMDR